MKTLTNISSTEWSDLILFATKKILGENEYPYPYGIKGYFDEVISSLRHIKDGKCEALRPNRLSPILTYEFLPYFIVIWLHEHGFYNAA